MKIKDYLEEKKLSMAEFGRLVGVSTSHVSLILGGKRKPSPSLVKKIIKVTEGSITWEDIYGE